VLTWVNLIAYSYIFSNTVVGSSTSSSVRPLLAWIPVYCEPYPCHCWYLLEGSHYTLESIVNLNAELMLIVLSGILSLLNLGGVSANSKTNYRSGNGMKALCYIWSFVNRQRLTAESCGGYRNFPSMIDHTQLPWVRSNQLSCRSKMILHHIHFINFWSFLKPSFPSFIWYLLIKCSFSYIYFWNLYELEETPPIHINICSRAEAKEFHMQSQKAIP